MPAIILLAVGGVFFIAHPAHAQFTDLIKNELLKAIGFLVESIVSLLGKIALMLIHILISVAKYNDFVTSPAVVTGWVIVRDISNMFFVILLLVVAIGTIVGSETYNWQKNLFRILLAALFINFSKTIAGLFIDFTQVIMLTFVNGFSAAAGGNFTEALGVTKLTNFSINAQNIDFLSTFGALIFSVVIMVITVVVLGIIIASLVVRMIYLWFLVVLSPLAFLLTAFPSTKKHSDEWWSRFSAQLSAGPILAFFLWLTLVAVQTSNASPTAIAGPNGIEDRGPKGEVISVQSCPTEACDEPNVIRYIIAVSMLVGGLMVTQQFGGVAGGLAGSALGYGQGKLTAFGKYAARRAAPIVGAAALGPGAVVAAGAFALSPKLRTSTLRGVGRVAGAGYTVQSGPLAGTRLGIPGGGALKRGIDSYQRASEAKKTSETSDRLKNVSGPLKEQRYDQLQLKKTSALGLSAEDERELAVLTMDKSKNPETIKKGSADQVRGIAESLLARYKGTSDDKYLDEYKSLVEKRPDALSGDDARKNLEARSPAEWGKINQQAFESGEFKGAASGVLASRPAKDMADIVSFAPIAIRSKLQNLVSPDSVSTGLGEGTIKIDDITVEQLKNVPGVSGRVASFAAGNPDAMKKLAESPEKSRVLREQLKTEIASQVTNEGGTFSDETQKMARTYMRVGGTASEAYGGYAERDAEPKLLKQLDIAPDEIALSLDIDTLNRPAVQDKLVSAMDEEHLANIVKKGGKGTEQRAAVANILKVVQDNASRFPDKSDLREYADRIARSPGFATAMKRATVKTDRPSPENPNFNAL